MLTIFTFLKKSFIGSNFVEFSKIPNSNSIVKNGPLQLPRIALTASFTDTVPSPSTSIFDIIFRTIYPTRFSSTTFSSGAIASLAEILG